MKNLLLAALLGLATPIDVLAQDMRFDGATAWLNSPALSAADLRGKVVLVQFGTYTCINWMRTLPHTRAWAEKYTKHGLVLVNVHTPEFEFEKNLENVRRHVKDLRLAFPVAVDNEFAVWRAFANNAWPALYLIDAQGRVRYRHLGEGEYERSEKMIQQLLGEAGAADVPRELVSVEGKGAEVAADWKNIGSPETYLGYARAENRVRAVPARLSLNQWTASGHWTEKKEAIALQEPNGRIAFRFHARDLHMVMGPAMAGSKVRFRVLIDGKPPAAAHGLDIDAQGNGVVTEQRMYQLVRQPQPIADRLFEIEFLDPAVEAYVFTFG